MIARKHPSFWIACAMLFSIVSVYFPYRHNMQILYRFWDGPLYMYVAKTFYQVPPNHPFEAYNLPPIYFASHFPLYPILIRICSWLTLGNYPPAMLLATASCSIAAAVLFYRLLRVWNLVESPFWTALLFCFLPPRWVIYHSMGVTEPLFLCMVFGAFLALRAEKPLLVMICTLLASLTRITGALLLPVFGIIYLYRKQPRNLLLLSLASFGVVAVFTFYHFAYGDFFAYFRWNASQHKIIDWHPLAIFRLYASQVNFHSTELYLGTYILYGLGTLALWKHREIFVYCAIFFLFHCFVFHLDLSRYILVLAPFALLVAFDPILSLPPCRWILPLALYLDYIYAWGWLPLNVCNEDAYQKLLTALAQ